MNSKYLPLIIFFLIILDLDNIQAREKNIMIMGFKEVSKLPLIGNMNNNSGLYQQLFQKALEKIGYKLKIVRFSKNVIHHKLNKGIIDFYPGASFSQKRAKYLYYIPNGLQTKEVLVTLSSWPKIHNMNQAKGRLLAEYGSSKMGWNKKYSNLQIVVMSKLPFEKVFQALKHDRGDFYVADIEVIDYFKRLHKLKSFRDIGIKIHKNAINKKLIPMYLGFSRKSPFFKEDPNPNYDPNEKVSISNFPTLLSKKCPAYKLSKALLQLKQNNITHGIYNTFWMLKDK